MSDNTLQTEQLIIKLLKQLERKGKNIQTFLWKLMDEFEDEDEQFDEKNDEAKRNINNKKISLLYNRTDKYVCDVGHGILSRQKHLATEQCIICGNRNNNNKQNKITPNNNQILQFLNQYPTNQIAFGPHKHQKGEIKYWVTNGRDKKWPLHYAAISGDIKKIEQLSKNKNINIDQKQTDEDDETPIVLAARNGQLQSVIELIKQGSNPIAPPDKACGTPYDKAVYFRHKAIVVFFEEYIKYLYNFDINHDDTNLECYMCYNYDLHFNKHLINGTMAKYVYCKRCTLENVETIKQVQQNNKVMERRIITTLRHNPSISVDTLCQMKDVKSLHSILKQIMVSGKTFAYWLWLLDIDNFKAVNSQLTHAIADTKIQAVGQVLKSLESLTGSKQWRENGYDGLINVWAFRQGGDEFALVTRCNGQKTDILQKLYEKIKNDINAIKLENMPTMKHITVSIGACHGQGIMDYEQMMKKADEAAEMVKKDGKNGIAIYTQWSSRQNIWKRFNDIS